MDASVGPFSLVATAWTQMLQRAQAKKNLRFMPEALEGLRFYSGPYDFFFNQMRTDKFFRMPRQDDGDADIVVTVNKVAELVEIFGPTLYHRNPTRRCTTRPVPKIDPNVFTINPQMAMLVQQVFQQSMMEQMTDRAMSQLFEAILNVTPTKNDLKEHSRWTIDETLITGLGTLWHDYKVMPATGRKVCGSYWHSVNDLLMDPDAVSIKHINWCSRRTVMHRCEVERRWRIPPGYIKANQYTSNAIAGNLSIIGPSTPIAPDSVEVFEIWSKMGCGGRLPQVMDLPAEYRVAYELLGDYCYMVIIPNHPWPLNLPPWMFQQPNAWEQAKKATQWPTPYWVENAWPFTPFYFHTIPNDPWPMSHLTPGMGYLKFLNWVYAKMASKIAVTSRDILFISDSLGDTVKQSIKYGPDLTVVELQGLEGKDIKQFIQQFQHQNWNEDFWKVIQAITAAFDDATGLTELMYGMSSRQMRSAEESARKFEQVNVRPDDMSNKVEDAMSACAQREMWCSRWHYDAEDVGSLTGIVGQFAWTVLVAAQPPERTLDLQCRVESDSSKKPNKSLVTDGLSQAMQTIAAPLFQAAQAGMLDPFNNLLGDYLDSISIPDKERYQLRMPPNVPIQTDPNQQAQIEAQKEIAASKPKKTA